MMSKDYIEFLRSKHQTANEVGFDRQFTLNPKLKPFQTAIVRWSLRLGRAAIFGDTGLGKTIMFLEYARCIHEETGGKILILAPLAVAQQTIREGKKFGIDVNYCRSQMSMVNGINITNYEMCDRFDPREIICLILDESSVLKSLEGKTKKFIIEHFSNVPYKLACTATPAPNDHVELGNHSEFLGVLPQEEMLTKYFVRDSGNTQKWKLKTNAREEFWRWVCTWAACFSKPSDLGFDDDGYILPPLNVITRVVDVDVTQGAGASGMLFRQAELTATTLARENRLTITDRVREAARIANESNEAFCCWVELNDEADAITKAIPDAVEVRGSQPLEVKEKLLNEFSDGKFRVLVSKTKICGFGMNWQHCHNTLFTGCSYKYESLYQAIRRFWRFGQVHPVNAYMIAAETEGPVLRALQRKQRDHEIMKEEMIRAMRESGSLDNIIRTVRLAPYHTRDRIAVPGWLVPRHEDGSVWEDSPWQRKQEIERDWRWGLER